MRGVFFFLQPTVSDVLLESVSYANSMNDSDPSTAVNSMVVSVLIDGYPGTRDGVAAAAAELASHAAPGTSAIAFANTARALSAAVPGGAAVNVSADPSTAQLRASLHVIMALLPASPGAGAMAAAANAADNLFSGAVNTGVLQAALTAQGYGGLITVIPSDPLQGQRNAAALAGTSAAAAYKLLADGTQVACSTDSSSATPDDTKPVATPRRPFRGVAIAFIIVSGVLLLLVVWLAYRNRRLAAALANAEAAAAAAGTLASTDTARGKQQASFSEDDRTSPRAVSVVMMAAGDNQENAASGRV